MRVAGLIAYQPLGGAGKSVARACTTDALARIAHDYVVGQRVERTHEATMRAIKAVKPGRAPSVVGRVIESYANRFGYNVVRDFTGHGIGTTFHNGLVVLHYDQPAVTTILEPGMTFTIEPMINLGSLDYEIWDDGWTVVTRDRKWTAQFEHTLVVTDDGAEILTLL